MGRSQSLGESAYSALTEGMRVARRLDHAWVDPEHVLIGLASLRDHSVTAVLQGFGVDLTQLKLSVEETLTPGEPQDTSEVKLSQRTKIVLRLANKEARQLYQEIVYAEHLLLALLSEDNGAPTRILKENGVTYQKVLKRYKRQTQAQRSLHMTKQRLGNIKPHLFMQNLVGSRYGTVPVEISPFFLGIVGVTILSGILLFFRVLPVFNLFLFVTGGWLISLCLHEFGHAYVAYLGGDTEVYYKGYLTLNPVKYTHPILSIVFPLLFLLLRGIALPGGAVYINRHVIREKRTHSLISLAGPVATLFTAIVFTLPFTLGLDHISFEEHREFWAGLAMIAGIEIISVVINLLPIPGIDGYGIIEPFLPPEVQQRLRPLYQFAFIILLVLFLTPLGGFIWAIGQVLFRIVGLDYSLFLLGYDLYKFWS